MTMIKLDMTWLDRMTADELKCELEDAIEYITILEKRLGITDDQ